MAISASVIGNNSVNYLIGSSVFIFSDFCFDAFDFPAKAKEIFMTRSGLVKVAVVWGSISDHYFAGHYV
jgi:hypothetical protein